MKRLLILSLLMMQGVWGAAAAGFYDEENEAAVVDAVPVQVEQPIQRPKSLMQSILQQLAQDFVVADDEGKEALINGLLFTGIKQEIIFPAFYVAWLNANPTQPIIVRQTAVQACQQMGIDNVPAEWAQLVVDVSSHLRHGITSLHTRPGTIADLIATGFAGLNNRFNFEEYNLTVCDVWNLPNPKTIEGLNLRCNQLTALPAGTFTELDSLTHLSLDENQITDLPAGTFAGLSALTHLWLDENQITDLSAGTFAGLGALTHLWLNGNQITDLSADVFVGLSALQELHLLDNKISTIKPGAFANLGKLRELKFGYNNDESIYHKIMNDPNDLSFIKKQHPEWFARPQAM